MAYSTIQKKKCKGEKCNYYPQIGLSGYCLTHAPEDIVEKFNLRRKAAIKARNQRIALQSKVRGLKRLNDEGSNLLELWFSWRMNIFEPKCDNCGAYRGDLLNWKEGWKSCQAHILPKRHFKSIQSNPLNGLVLGSGFSGLCNCHDLYDSSWEAASKMKIWAEVVNRFLSLYKHILPSERRFIPNVLLDTLELADTSTNTKDTQN